MSNSKDNDDDIPIDRWNFRFRYFCNVTSLSARHQAPSCYSILHLLLLHPIPARLFTLMKGPPNERVVFDTLKNWITARLGKPVAVPEKKKLEPAPNLSSMIFPDVCFNDVITGAFDISTVIITLSRNIHI